MPSATKSHTVFRCSACGKEFPRWVGRCTECGEWGSVAEGAQAQSPAGSRARNVSVGTVATAARRVSDIPAHAAKHSGTGIGELDRVLGGGLVKGAAILLSGEPGVGKSTLLLEVADKAAKTGKTVLIASGEETAEQIKLRADRVGADANDLFIASETDLSVVLAHIEQVQPDLLIADSIQAFADPSIDGRAGGVAQTSRVAHVLTAVAKERGIALLLVGQVTKNNEIAGARTVEHLVDVVLHFEGDKHSRLRLLRAVKNRFGAADEVACFEHTERGITEVPDPSGLFVDTHNDPVPGSCLTVNLEGRRALLAEIQALVNTAFTDKPRRGVSGLDTARVNLVLAVLESRGGIRLGTNDVYTSTVGGLRVTDPGVDLSIALATASAAKGVAMPAGVAAIGEVGLSGALRPVPAIGLRLREAARVGCRTVLVPPGTDNDGPAGLHVITVRDLREALRATGIGNSRSK